MPTDQYPDTEMMWQDFNAPTVAMTPSMQLDEYGISSSLDALEGCASSSFLPFEQSQYFPNVFDENTADDVSVSDPGSTSDTELEPGNPLLSFAPSNHHYRLFDASYNPAPISLSAQLSGKFIYANSAASPNGASAVVCYRRNLFSVTGLVTAPRNLRYISSTNGDYQEIISTELAITASESLDRATIKLISIPFKSSQVVPTGCETNGDREAGNLPLAGILEPSADSEYVTSPFEWRRLQFRNSTANNGRRKELQQHFVVSIQLIATLTHGQRISIGESSSSHIIVRGRSPRNFQPKKEMIRSTTERLGPSRSATTTPYRTVKLEPSNSSGHDDLHLQHFGAWATPNTVPRQSESMPTYMTETYPFRTSDAGLETHPAYSQFQPQTSPALSTWPHPNDQSFVDGYFGSALSHRSRASSSHGYQTPRYVSSAAESSFVSNSYNTIAPPSAASWASIYPPQAEQEHDTSSTKRSRTPKVKAKRLRTTKRTGET